MSAIPRPASTVVLMDDTNKVYLTKRPISMKFMGGFYVFPGGAVEDFDQEVNLEHIDSTSIHDSLDIAYYIAAARELFEEVGILLGQNTSGEVIQLPKDKKEAYRKALLNEEITFNDILKQEMLYLDLHSLNYFGQIITPRRNPIRFDTRFFLTKLPHGQVPDPDKFEIDEAFWISPDQAILSYQSGKIRLAPPTIVSLKAVMKFQQGGALEMSVEESELLEILRKQR